MLRGLEAATRRIARTLSVSDRDVPPSTALRRALVRDERALPGPARELAPQAPRRPSSALARLAAHRLAAPSARARGAYAEPGEFVADLDVLQRSLDAGGAPALAWGELQHLRWQAETFGFHLAEMEKCVSTPRCSTRPARAGAAGGGERALARPAGPRG